MAQQSGEKFNLNETNIIWENRSYIMSMKGDIETVRNDIGELKQTLKDFIGEVRINYVTRREMNDALAPIRKNTENISSSINKVVWIIIGTVVVSLLGLILKPHI